jgi:hypothetical protein
MSKTFNLASHRVYAVTGGKQKYWHAIGAAFPHRDGDGFFLKLDYLPLNGAQILIRKPKSNEAEAAPAEVA